MTSGGFIGAAALAAAGALVFPFGSQARAEATPWIATERGAVRLVAATTGTGTRRTLDFGLEFRFEPGWKTYWRVPGESGVPPRFDWESSQNIRDAAVIWPAPARFAIAGMQSYGYAGRVILPVRAELAAPGQAASLRLHLRYAICREVCVPEEARLRLDLPRGPARAAPHAAAIAAFLARAPKPGARLGWAVEQARILRMQGGAKAHAKLVVEVTSATVPFEAPELIAEGDGQSFGLSKAKIAADGRRARLVLPYRSSPAAAHAAEELTLTLIDGARSGIFAVRPREP